MKEIVSLGNNIMQNNNNLIKLIRVYIINNDKDALDTYNSMLEDPSSFDDKLDRMIEVGLVQAESDIVNETLSQLDILAGIEKSSITAMESENHEEAISILFSSDYISADNSLSQLTVPLIEHIEDRFQHSVTIIHRWVSIILVITFLMLFASTVIIIRMQLWQRNRVLDPIKKIGNIADKIAIGDIGVSLQKEFGDEIGILVDSFNNMLESIQVQANVVRQITSGNYIVDVQKRSEKEPIDFPL